MTNTHQTYGGAVASAPRSTRFRHLSFVVAVLVGLLPLVAQAGTIAGRVLDNNTKQYLRNAQVQIVGTDRTTITEDNGEFYFPEVAPGEITLSITYPGLDTLVKTITVPEDGVLVQEFAMTNKLYGDDVLVMEAFKVATEREGNAKAIVDQKQASNVKTVIAADAFGSVSEDNVGEFLKYMSGLNVDYVENDARTVRVRGLSSKYASITIDGNPVASADFNIGTGRDFQFEQVSLSTLDTISLNKTPLADQPASSLAGTIDVKSKSAFSQKGRRIKYSANLTLNEYAFHLDKTIGWDNQKHYKALPGGSLEFSDTFLDGRLGVVASINHTGTYVEQKIIANLGRVFTDGNPDNNSTEIPRINQVNWQDGLKPTWRDSALINIDYKVTPDMTLSLRTSYAFYDAPFHNRNWTFAANTATNDLSVLNYNSMATNAANVSDTNNSVTIAGTNFRKYGATFSINPALNWRITDNVTLDASLSYSRSYQWYDSDAEGFFNIVSVRMNAVNWAYTSDSGQPNLQLRQLANRRDGSIDTRSFFDLANYNSNASATIATRDAKDQFYTARTDATIKFPQWRFPTVFKTGLDSRMLVKNIDTWTRTWGMTVGSGAGAINLNNYADPYISHPDKDESITDVNGVRGTPPNLDKWKLYDLFRNYNTDPLALSYASPQPFTANAAANLRNKLQNMWDLKETINSAYILGNMKLTSKLLVVAGLRFESTETQGRQFDDIGGTRAVALSGTTNTNDFNYIYNRYGKRATKKQSYDDLFPSMQARYSVSNDFVVRGAYYRSILRPDAANIARGLVANDALTSFQTANPDLKPEYADNFETRVEYYFEPVGVVSAGVFYKNIQDIQVSTLNTLDPNDLPQEFIDLGIIPEPGAVVTWTTNLNELSLWGLELDYSQQLSFLPGALSGLSVFANYTFTKPEDRTLFALSGNATGSGIPKHTANAGINYRLRRFNGGVKFNWVGERLLSVQGLSINNTTGQVVVDSNPNDRNRYNYERERLQIDLNLNYELHRRATLFLNVANMLNEPSVRYAEHSANLIRHGAYGAKYTFGIKGTF